MQSPFNCSICRIGWENERRQKQPFNFCFLSMGEFEEHPVLVRERCAALLKIRYPANLAGGRLASQTAILWERRGVCLEHALSFLTLAIAFKMPYMASELEKSQEKNHG